MSIANTNPNPKDVVILQRDATNTYYAETHISASDVILHIDSTGFLTADKSSSFYTLYPPPGASSGASTSASWASQSLSSSYSLTASYALNAAGGNNIAGTASVGFVTLDSGLYSTVPKFGTTGIMGASNITVTSGGTIKVNASALTPPAAYENMLYIGRDGNPQTWAGLSFYNDAGATNAKYWLEYADQSNVLEFAAARDDFSIITPWLTVTRNASAISSVLFQEPVTFKGNVLPNTSLTYSLGTSSLQWKDAYIQNMFGTASLAISASWAPTTFISASFASRSFFATSASWASRSISSSNADTASFLLGTIASATTAISASWASQSLSASYAQTASFLLGSVAFTVSSSWASASIFSTSASFASASIFSISSSWASQSLFNLSSSWASSSITSISSTSASYAITSSNADTASFLLGSINSAVYATSASWASSSLTASFLLGSIGSAIFATSASWASRSISSSNADTASFLLGNVGSANFSISSSWASASIFTVSSSFASASLSTISASFSSTSSYPWTLSPFGHPYHQDKIVVIGATAPVSASRLYVTEPTLNFASNSVVSIYGNRTDSNPVFVDIRNTAAGAGAYSGLNLSLANNNTEGGRIFVTRAATPASGIVNGLNFSPNSGSTSIGFRVGAALTGGVSGPALQIISSGIIGMGVATPSACRLHLGGTEIPLYCATIRLTNGNAGGADAFLSSTDTGWGGASSNKFVIGTGDPSAGGVSKFQIDLDTGNLGVNMSSGTDPVATLDVVGNINATTVTASWFLGTASFAVSASWAPGTAGTTLVTASTYPITSSWAVSASWSPSGNAGTTLVTASTYPITSSWAVSASWAPGGVTSSVGKVVVLCSAYTPTATGADSAEVPMPYDSVDGITPVTWSVRRINFRVQLSGSTPSTVTIEKSTGTGIFSAVSLGTITLSASLFETFTGSIGTIYSGEKMRFNVNTLGAATNWTLTTEIGSI